MFALVPDTFPGAVIAPSPATIASSVTSASAATSSSDYALVAVRLEIGVEVTGVQ